MPRRTFGSLERVRFDPHASSMPQGGCANAAFVRTVPMCASGHGGRRDDLVVVMHGAGELDLGSVHITPKIAAHDAHDPWGYGDVFG